MKPGVAVVLVAGCISPVMHFGGGKTNEEGQHDRAKDLTPPLLVPIKTRPGIEIAPQKVRVWADDDYRAQNVDWKHSFGEQLEYANAVLGPEFGIKLVPEYESWSYHAQDASLQQTLNALAEHDPGDGALVVIGLTSALSAVDTNVEHLGMAMTPGKYIAIRGYANIAERQAFTRAFPELSEEERENLHEARHHYQGAAVLLHELGHSMGALHENDQASLMYPSATGKAASYSEQTHDTMAATLDARLHRGGGEHVEPAAPVVAQGPRQLEISIGVLGLDHDGVRIDDAGYVALLKQATPSTELILHFRKGAPRRRLAELMDTAKAAGITKISLAGD